MNWKTGQQILPKLHKREKRLKIKSNQSLRDDFTYNFTEVPEKEMGRSEKVLKNITVENILNLAKDINLQIRESLTNPK